MLREGARPGLAGGGGRGPMVQRVEGESPPSVTWGQTHIWMIPESRSSDSVVTLLSILLVVPETCSNRVSDGLW